MEKLLQTPEFDFVNEANKAFILAFDAEMAQLGYTFDGSIGSGFCWGRKMVIYTKADVKSKKSYARLYLKEDGLTLRLYFSDIDKHREAIESAPNFIKAAFTGSYGRCGHCHNQREDGSCGHRKCYTLDGQAIEFCDGYAFWFKSPQVGEIPEYIKLFQAFYPPKKIKKKEVCSDGQQH